MDGLLVSGFTGYSGCPDHGRDGESECCLVTGGGYRFGELGGGERGRDE